MCFQAEAGRSRSKDTDRPPASIRAPELAKKYGFNFGTGVVPGSLAEYYAYGKGQPPNPVIAAHSPSSAARAASTAASTSSGPASGIRAHGRPV